MPWGPIALVLVIGLLIVYSIWQARSQGREKEKLERADAVIERMKHDAKIDAKPMDASGADDVARKLAERLHDKD